MRKKVGEFIVRLPRENEEKNFFIWADMEKDSKDNLFTNLEFNVPPEYHYIMTSLAKDLQDKHDLITRVEWITTRWKDYLKLKVRIDMSKFSITEVLDLLTKYKFNYHITNRFEFTKDEKFIIGSKILEKL